MTWKKFNFENNQLSMGECIGRGSFSCVKRATLGGFIVVVKELYFNVRDSFDDECPENSFAEFYLQRYLTENAQSSDETGVLEIFSFFMMRNSRYAIFPYCEFSLAQAMPVIQKLRENSEENAKTLYQKIVLGFFLSMLNALKTLSNKNIVHRDIKPQNILFSPDKSNDDLMRWCLSDFGCAFDLSKGSDSGTHGTHGTQNYFAPESRGKTARYDLLTNIWGVAHVLFQIFNEQNLTRTSTFILDEGIASYSSVEQSEKIRALLNVTLTEEKNIKEQEVKNNINDAKTFSACLNLIATNMHEENPDFRVSLAVLEFAAKKLEILSPKCEESDRSRFFSLVHDDLAKQTQTPNSGFTLVSDSGNNSPSVIPPQPDALRPLEQPQLDTKADTPIFFPSVSGALNDSSISLFAQRNETLHGVSNHSSTQANIKSEIQNGFRQLKKLKQHCTAMMIAEEMLIPQEKNLPSSDGSSTKKEITLIKQWQLFLVDIQGDATWLLGENPPPTAKIPVSQLISLKSRLQHQKWVDTMFRSDKNIRSTWYSFFNGMLKRPFIFLPSPPVRDTPCETEMMQPVDIEMKFISEPDRHADSRHWSFFVEFKKHNSTSPSPDTMSPNRTKECSPTFKSFFGT
jgi:serine/threonine protein kinase